MAHNKLRRQIEAHLQDYGTGRGVDPDAVMATLRRTLDALGGPVAPPCPPQATLPTGVNAQGDPGDENDSLEHAPGLGACAIHGDACPGDAGTLLVDINHPDAMFPVLTEDVHHG